VTTLHKRNCAVQNRRKYLHDGVANPLEDG